MPHHLNKLTPNLIVSDVSRSIAFYRDVLGFTLAQTVPDAGPFVFAIVRSGNVEIFLNASGPAQEEYSSIRTATSLPSRNLVRSVRLQPDPRCSVRL